MVPSERTWTITMTSMTANPKQIECAYVSSLAAMASTVGALVDCCRASYGVERPRPQALSLLLTR
eukprot:6076469-Prymnesium_polylepis.1